MLSILSIVLFLYSSYVVGAQERVVIDIKDSYQETRNQIRGIKLSNEYYYFDAVGNDLKRVEADAVQLLGVYIMQQHNTTELHVDSLMKLYGSTMYYVTSDRYYVCAYIPKSHFQLKSIDSLPTVKQYCMTLADSLATYEKLSELGVELQRLHLTNRVMYGRMDMIKNIDPCYIVVFDSTGKVTAFLEPGGEQRVDLKSGNSVALVDFLDVLTKIWLIIY